MEITDILGTGISCIASYEEAYFELLNFIKIGNPEYITVNNVHTVIEAVLRYEYRNILNQSILSLPDGKPLSVVAKLKGVKNISRIFGPTFYEYVLNKSSNANISHFFFGSSPDTLEKLKVYIQTKYPSLKIAGMIAPPYREFSEQENIDFIKAINNSKPDIIWIGLGAPKQEIWIYQNYKNLSGGIMIGIGAGFDYVAGNLKHAPKWMKNMSLEWLYRLIQEPRRLWKRYLITNTLFIFLITLDLLRIKKYHN